MSQKINYYKENTDQCL